MQPNRRVDILRAAEELCLARGVDALSLSDVGLALGVSRGTVAEFFHDETTLLDAILERHQTPYERGWEERLPRIEAPREALRLLVSSVAALIHDADGGPAYVAIAAQMCASARFPLTGRQATTTPAALKLMSKLTAATQLPFGFVPLHFERFATVLFASVSAWHRHGTARVADAVFIEDLVDTLEFLVLAAPTAPTREALAR